MKSVKGMRHVSGISALKYQHIVKRFQTVLEKEFGFEQTLARVVENEQVFAKTLGVTSDIVLKEMYRVQGGENSKEKLVLRPEGTAGVLNNLLSEVHYSSLTNSPHRLWYQGPMFRHERPQAGRLRQFYQFGAEIIGGPQTDKGNTVQNDFAAIQSAWKCLVSIYGQKLDCCIEINNLGNRETLVNYNKHLIDQLMPMRADLSPVSQLRLDSGHALRILDSKLEQDQVICESLDNKVIDDFTSDSQREGFNEVLDLLTAFEIPWKRNHKLVRGLDYYNGTSFEIKAVTSESLGPSQSTLLAGGRYDYLAQQFSGKEVPAIGWAAGIDRLAILMPDELIPVSTTPVIGIIAMLSKDERYFSGSQVRHKCLQLQNRIQESLGVHVEVDLRESGKLPNRLDTLLNHKKASSVIVVGVQELETGVFTVKKDKHSLSISEDDLLSALI